ncbi:MAG: molybdenum cofactor guanylyltransferase [Chlorobiales bacterium]|nr:molybdenum cofactor guanylyltransferase [Chlorobiales bacterium]
MNAFILTGGQSRRFGSDKSLARINDHTFAEHIYQCLTKKFPGVALVGKVEKHQGLPFIHDVLAVQCPLTGIYSGLLASQSDWSFFVGVDLPLVSIPLIEHLEPYLTTPYQVALPEANGKKHPLCAFYHRSLIPSIKASLDNQNYRMMDLIGSVPHHVIDADLFTAELLNVNTWEAFKKLQSLAEKRKC